MKSKKSLRSLVTNTSAGTRACLTAFSIMFGSALALFGTAPHTANAASLAGIAVPAYFSPEGDPSDWAQITAWGPSTANAGPVKIAIMVGGYEGPPSNAPTATTCTYVTDTNYVNEITACHTAGIKVYGYVHCMAGCRPYAANKTWNGLYDNGVNADINNWFNVYHVDGIFLDEGPGVGTWSAALPEFHPYSAPSGTYVQPISKNITGNGYYTPVYNLIWGTHSGAVILNPGGPTDAGYMNVANIICVMEEDYSDYMTNAWVADQFESGGGLSWVTEYPASRFMHIINSIPYDTPLDVDNAVELAISRHDGYIYCTDESYSTLPSQVSGSSVWGENMWDAGHY